MEKIVLKSAEAIKSDQDQIRVNLINLDKSVHDNAVQCLLHAEKHGDTSLMTRLLTDVLTSKSGYRVQGLVNWMRKHSPMELSGKVINLSGMVKDQAQVELMIKAFPKADKALFVIGERRPFMIQEANETPFWNDSANAERVARPVYRDTLFSKLDTAAREFDNAMANTANGKPIDPSKAFYDGVHADKVVDFFAEVKKLKDQLPADATREVRQAQDRIKNDLKIVEHHDQDVKKQA